MCFLPLGCLKAITTIGAIISIVISFTLLGVTIYANVYKKKIIDQASEGTINSALVFAYIGSIVFLLLGIAGLYGSLKGGKGKKGNPCLLGLYSIGVILFFFIFFSATLIFFLGPKTIFSSTCDGGAADSLNMQLYTKSKQVNDRFCKATCPCYVDSSYLTQQLKTNNFTNVVNDTSKATKYQSCPGYNGTTEDHSVLLLGALEEVLGCGGWCEAETFKFYRFTNVNTCNSEGILLAYEDCLKKLPGCYQAFKDFMNNKAEIIAIVCLFATIICLLNLVVVCCICCHPTKAGKKKNFYARMIDTDN